MLKFCAISLSSATISKKLPSIYVVFREAKEPKIVVILIFGSITPDNEILSSGQEEIELLEGALLLVAFKTTLPFLGCFGREDFELIL